MFNKFELMKITMKTVLRIFIRTCKTVSRKSCINIESKSKSSKFIYTDIVFEITMKFLAGVTPPYIYHDFYTQKTFWEEKFAPAKMISCGHRNVIKHK